MPTYKFQIGQTVFLRRSLGVAGSSRNRLGAYLLCSESALSSLIGALMIASYAQVSDQIYLSS